MPGYILHLTAAKMALDRIEKQSGKTLSEQYKNDFFVGSLLPDTVKNKNASHFRNPRYHDKMIEYPDLEMFLEKYKSLIGDVSCLGYYFHLYVDHKFFKEYLPEIVMFLDEQGQQVTKRDEVFQVKIKSTGERIFKKEFFSKEYYYGDYTRMNTYLVERFQLLLQLDVNVENPGIEEVDYADAEKVLEELQGYLGVPAEEVKEVRVFEVEKLLEFLEKITEDFISTIKQSKIEG